jgi:Mlc titration factor MtfA (ptsG expression regulator)
VWSLRGWRRRRVLARSTLDDALWAGALEALPVLDRLSPADIARLRDLAVLFMHEKAFEGGNGFVIDDRARLVIALQACLPLLNLGLDWLDGWVSVIVYPDEFIPEHEYVDEAGVVHVSRHPLSGESWHRGPLILSWADVEHAGRLDGYNVVIHEVAHKLDALNGETNGHPPLHRDMHLSAWAHAFSAAYDGFCRRVDGGAHTEIDPYAAESPAEFFAVLSEAFFEIPEVLLGLYPDVYGQLRAFYRQDPAAGPAVRP